MRRHKTTDQTEVRNKQKLKPEEIFLDNEGGRSGKDAEIIVRGY